jgi:RNA polymerase sigma-70 factor (ECF subfamily)
LIGYSPPPWGAATWDEVWQRALSCARRYARHPDDAEDIAQEALLRAWRHRETLRHSERFAGWLTTIVRNEAARDASRIRPEPADATAENGEHEDERMSQVVMRADLEVGLRELQRDEQLLLRMRYEEDLTQAAIARSLDLPEGTVKVRLHRARNKLRGLLSEP